jgi:uncharacterized protein (DUF305 family)
MYSTRFCRLVVAASLMLAAPSLGAQPAAPASRQVTAADIQFMQEMIGHHNQAVEMTALVPTRTRRRDLVTLGARISISQTDEIGAMRRWLTRHGADAPPVTAHATPGYGEHASSAGAAMPGMPGMHLMPGMLSAAQMTALTQARGRTFERLFLQGMIQHHEGALAMVKALMETPGAAQESALNRFVNDVSADQRAEIARMRRLIPRT